MSENASDVICVNCYFVYDVERDSEGASGSVCRRFPPVMNPMPAIHPITGEQGVTFRALYPVVADDFWCGEFKESPPGVLTMN